MRSELQKKHKMENNPTQNNNNRSTENLTEDENEDDYLVKSIGAFGIWQAGVCIIASSMRYTAMTNMFSIVFLTPSTNFTCVKFDENEIVNVEDSVCYSNCAKYEYKYNNVFEDTLTTEFDLICERMWMEGFTQTILILGFLFGVSLFGWISDRYVLYLRINKQITTCFNFIRILKLNLKLS